MKVFNAVLIFLMIIFAAFSSFGLDKTGVDVRAGFDAELETDFFRTARYFLDNRAKLGLSPDQANRITSLAKTVKKDLIKMNEQIKTLTVEVNTLMWESPANLDSTNDLVAEKYDIKKKKSLYLVKQTKNLTGILSREQLEKYKNI